MKNISLILGIILYLLLIINTSAQHDSLRHKHCHLRFSGKVIDGESQQPIEGATIYLKNISSNELTKANGEFSFHSLCADTYQIECSFLGFKTASIELSITQNTHKNFILHSDTCLLESVILTIVREERKTTQAFSEIKGKELEQSRGLSLGETLKSIPGVNTLQTGPTIFKPVIQGMYGNRVLIMNNGVRQEGQQWGSEHAPEIDPFLAGRITVIKGASGVRYGSDAIGGVILLDPLEYRKSNGIGGEVNLVGFSNNREGAASAIVDYRPAKLNGLVGRMQGTIKQAGNSKAPDYYLKNTGFTERNFSWALSYKRRKWDAEVFYSQFNSKVGIFSASHIGNLTDLQKAVSSSTPLETSGFNYSINRPYQNVAHELFKIKTGYRFNNIGKIDFTLARQFNNRSEFDKHRPYKNQFANEPQVEFTITTHTAEAVFTHYTINKFSGEVGSTFIHQANTTDGSAVSFIPNFRSLAGGAFWIERFKHKRLELEAGLRYDHKWMQIFKYQNNVLISPQYTFGNFSGTLGAIYTLNNHFKFRSNAGTSFRPPSVSELYSDGLHHGAARIEIGDNQLKPEFSYNINCLIQYSFSRIYGEINIYNNLVKDYIFLAPVLKYDSSRSSIVPDYRLTIRGAFPAFQYKQIDAMFTGVDFSFNDSLSKHWIIGAKASILRAYNLSAHEYLMLTPPGRIENALKYQLGKAYKNLSDLYLKASSSLVFRKSKVPSYEDIKSPPSTYFLLNVEAGCSVKMGKQHINFTLSVNNLLNTTYREYLDNFRYFADAIGRNFILRAKIPFGKSNN